MLLAQCWHSKCNTETRWCQQEMGTGINTQPLLDAKPAENTAKPERPLGGTSTLLSSNSQTSQMTCAQRMHTASAGSETSHHRSLQLHGSTSGPYCCHGPYCCQGPMFMRKRCQELRTGPHGKQYHSITTNNLNNDPTSGK